MKLLKTCIILGVLVFVILFRNSIVDLMTSAFMWPQQRLRERQEAENQARSERLQEVVRQMNNSHIQKAIEEHKVCQGMSETEVRTSIGVPDTIEPVSEPDLARKLKTRWRYGDESVFFDYQGKVLVATDGLSLSW